MKWGVKEFFFPKARKKFIKRVLLVAFSAFIWFRFITVPAWVSGSSMEPTYRDGALVFSLPWLPYFRSPQIGDIVTLRMSGRRVMLLKRIVAMPGDIVEFRQGWLYVNGEHRAEPYVEFRANWELAPREVKPGHVYVVGDNRGMDMDRHDFGQTEKDRIAGYPVW